MMDRTNAERQRHYIARRKAKTPVTNGPCDACAAKDREIARLTALVSAQTDAEPARLEEEPREK